MIEREELIRRLRAYDGAVRPNLLAEDAALLSEAADALEMSQNRELFAGVQCRLCPTHISGVVDSEPLTHFAVCLECWEKRAR